MAGRTIPIAPAAAIFDLTLGDPSVRPDQAMGREACENASEGPVQQGSFGAGAGATVGKLLGIDHAMKGGQGSASCASGEIVVGALVVVNAFGDITDMQGNLLAGARVSPDSGNSRTRDGCSWKEKQNPGAYRWKTRPLRSWRSMQR